jgi:putative transposase
MTAPHILNPAALLEKGLSDASPDLLRHLLSTVINTLLSADADAVCGAEYGIASADRVNSRNGYQHRDLDTRAGTIDVAIPKLRSGSYFPEWLLERRKRAESALNHPRRLRLPLTRSPQGPSHAQPQGPPTCTPRPEMTHGSVRRV